MARASRGGRSAWAVVTVVALGGCTMVLGVDKDWHGESSGGGGAPSSSATSIAGATTSSASLSTGSCTTDPGCTPCKDDVDCGPSTFDGCTVSTCVGLVCTPKMTTGDLAATQTPNDCKQSVCGADGKPTLVQDSTDLPPDDGNACTDQTCVGGTPTYPPLAMGMVCENGTCDDKGNCHNCNTSSDCKTGLMPTCDTTLHTCVSCSDNLQNGTETAVDCGGNCKTCVGSGCSTDFDCASDQCTDGVCCATACTGTCQACNVAGFVGACASVPIGDMDPGSCMDPAVACDGANSCKANTGKPCTLNNDCASNTCLAGVCRAPNGKPCVDNAGCASKLCTNNSCAPCGTDADCPSKSCAAGVCKAPGGAPCDADMDCAGNKCQYGLCLLDNNAACNAGLDCLSGFCMGALCKPCGSNLDCPASSSCGFNATLGFGACKLPQSAYCEPGATPVVGCNAGVPKCSGFPAKCQ